MNYQFTMLLTKWLRDYRAIAVLLLYTGIPVFVKKTYADASGPLDARQSICCWCFQAFRRYSEKNVTFLYK